MKYQYSTAEIEILTLEADDVIFTSGESENETPKFPYRSGGADPYDHA